MGHARQPVDHHQDRLRVDPSPPQLVEHAERHVSGVDERDLHPAALDHHPWIVEPVPLSRLSGEVCEVGEAGCRGPAGAASVSSLRTR